MTSEEKVLLYQIRDRGESKEAMECLRPPRKTLRELRIMSGLTIKGLGDAIGLAYNTIGDYEHFISMPTLRTARLIADYFSIGVEDIKWEE